jgi:G3E family GTPase
MTPHAATHPPIPLTILGGYLGAGKTTIINRLLAGYHGKRLTVLVNDFGAINIDAGLIAEHNGDTISLANGCACCQLQDDALKQLQELAAQATPPDHILVEASGAGEPAKLAFLGYGITGLQLAGVYTAIDAETIAAKQNDKFTGRLVKRQIAQADFCLLTKADLTPDDGAAARALISQLTDAPLATPDDAVLADMLTGAPSALPLAAADAPLFADDLFDSFALTADAPLDVDKLEAVLTSLPLLRAKGHCGTHRLQLVGDRYTLIAADTRPAALVFIAAKGAIDWPALEAALG